MRKFFLYIFIFGVYSNFSLYADEGSGKTLVFKNTILKAALEQISVSENINLVYSDEVIEKKTISGSYTFTDIDITLNKILVVVGLKIGIKKENVYVLVKDPIFDKKFSIKGIVLDNETGESLPYAQVVLLENGDNTIADKNGRFEFTNIPSGLFTLKTKYIGYSEFVYFFKSDSLTEDLHLPLSASNYKLKDVIIIDSTQNNLDVGINSSEIIIASKSLSNLPINGQADVFKSLKLLPGFNSNASGNSKLIIRGGFTSQNQIIIDGINLFYSDYLGGLYSTIPMDLVKDVRVYKSGYDASYGGKIAGIIDITTKNGNTRKAACKLELNSLGGSVFSEIPLANNLALIMSGRKLYSTRNINGLYKDIITSHKVLIDEQVLFTSKPKLSFEDIYSKITYLPGGNSLITASIFYINDEGDISFDDLSNTEYGEPGIDDSELLEKRKNRNWGIGVSWYHSSSSGVKFKSSLSYSNYDSEESKTINMIDSTGIAVTNWMSENNLENLSFKFGLEHKINSSFEYKTGVEFQNTKTNYLNKLTDYEDLIHDGKFNLGTYYFQTKLKLLNRILVSPGFRINYSSITEEAYFEPRISFNLNLSGKLDLKFAYGKYNQFLIQNSESNRFIYNVPNWLIADGIDYSPSHSEHYVAGFTYKLNGYIFDCEYYYLNKKNVFAPYYKVASEYYYYDINNNVSGLSKGFEVQFIKNSGSITGWINYTYTDAHVSAAFDSFVKRLKMREISPHLFNIVVDYKFGNWNLSTSFVYGTGSTYYFDGDLILDSKKLIYLDEKTYFYEDKLQDFSRVDLSIKKEFDFGSIKIQMGLSVYNLLDKQNNWNNNNRMWESGEEIVNYYDYGRMISYFAKIIL